MRLLPSLLALAATVAIGASAAPTMDLPQQGDQVLVVGKIPDAGATIGLDLTSIHWVGNTAKFLQLVIVEAGGKEAMTGGVMEINCDNGKARVDQIWTADTDATGKLINPKLAQGAPNAWSAIQSGSVAETDAHVVCSMHQLPTNVTEV